jgi:hypothetical protein
MSSLKLDFGNDFDNVEEAEDFDVITNKLYTKCIAKEICFKKERTQLSNEVIFNEYITIVPDIFSDCTGLNECLRHQVSLPDFYQRNTNIPIVLCVAQLDVLTDGSHSFNDRGYDCFTKSLIKRIVEGSKASRYVHIYECYANFVEENPLNEDFVPVLICALVDNTGSKLFMTWRIHHDKKKRYLSDFSGSQKIVGSKNNKNMFFAPELFLQNTPILDSKNVSISNNKLSKESSRIPSLSSLIISVAE